MQVFLPSESDVYDVIVIGGGPAGATAALYTARAGLKTIVIDKGITGSALGKTGQIANFPGVPGPIPGAQLVRSIQEQAASFGATLIQDKVLRVDLTVTPRQVWTGQGLYLGRAIIIATGSMGRAGSLPGEERLIGRGVSYCAICDGAFFRDQEVAVLGNNDEAVEEALLLTRFASRVHLLSPTRHLQVSAEKMDELTRNPKVLYRPSTHIEKILGEDGVEGLQVVHAGKSEILPVRGVFIYLQGNAPVTDFLEGQLPLGEGGCLLVDENFQTAIPGVFAVGDVLCRHLKQAVVAAAEGAVAAIAAERFLRGRTDLRPDWAR